MIHPVINAHPDAPDGLVHHHHHYTVRDFPPDSAVLCRNNAPLLEFAMALLARGVACHVVGRDVQVGLERLLERGAQVPGDISKLQREGKPQQAASLDDKWRALCAIRRGCRDDAEVKQKLARVFASGPGVTLSTIHRAKGLEWDTVFLLDWGLLPSPFAVTPRERQQERNLQYIAVTRARLRVIFVNSGKWATAA